MYSHSEELIFNEVITTFFYQQNTSFQNDYILRNLNEWKEKKEHLYHLFGDKLILKNSEEEIGDFHNDYLDFLSDARAEVRLYHDKTKNREVISQIDRIINFESFQSGIINFDENEKNCFTGDDLKVKGMKVNKSISKILPEDARAMVISLQNLYSRYRQKMLTSKANMSMYLSIDPLDYLTISQNDSNWTSCMSLDDDDSDSHRGGVMEFMNDRVTLVAYLLKDSDDFDNMNVLSEIAPWNDKKWRVLVHIDTNENGETSIIYNRQYPFEDEHKILALDKFIKRELFKDELFSELKITDHAPHSNNASKSLVDGIDVLTINYFHNRNVLL